MNREQAVVVKTFSNEMFARMAALHLEAMGIESMVHKYDCGGAYPQLQLTGGVRLMVEPGDKERAAAYLAQVETAPLPEDEPADESPHRFPFLSGFVLGFVVASFLFMILRYSL